MPARVQAYAGEMHLSRNDWDSAEKAFQEACNLEPFNGEWLAHLAWTLYRNPNHNGSRVRHRITSYNVCYTKLLRDENRCQKKAPYIFHNKLHALSRKKTGYNPLESSPFRNRKTLCADVIN